MQKKGLCRFEWVEYNCIYVEHSKMAQSFTSPLVGEVEKPQEARKLPGFHDEPLRGERKGQRSIRLNHAYRAIYVEEANGITRLISIIEVNKHEY